MFLPTLQVLGGETIGSGQPSVCSRHVAGSNQSPRQVYRGAVSRSSQVPGTKIQTRDFIIVNIIATKISECTHLAGTLRRDQGPNRDIGCLTRRLSLIFC